MFDETLRNLRNIPPTCCANVPSGYAALAAAMQAHNRTAGSSDSLRVARALLMTELPSIDGLRECTDKGYINQRAGLGDWCRRPGSAGKLPGRKGPHHA